MTSRYDEEELTRKQRREQARAERKELEASEQASQLLRKRARWTGGVVTGVLVAAIVIVAANGGSSHRKTAPASVSAGILGTPAPWAPENTHMLERLQALKLPTQSDGAYHVHAVLRVYIQGKHVPVPADIGIEKRAETLAPLHTHNSSGVIHIEASEQYPFTLGQFFTLWGVKFTNSQLGSYASVNGNQLAVFVNGEQVANPVGYLLKGRDQIVVGYGKTGSFPTGFKFDWAAAGV